MTMSWSPGTNDTLTDIKAAFSALIAVIRFDITISVFTSKLERNVLHSQRCAISLVTVTSSFKLYVSSSMYITMINVQR